MADKQTCEVRSTLVPLGIGPYMHVGGIFCDLAKAFDCVDREIQLTERHFYGIQGIVAEWFRSYLTDRKQKVEVKSPTNNQNFFSNFGTIKHGVPQRSVLVSNLEIYV
jgi:hypothetical protein